MKRPGRKSGGIGLYSCIVLALVAASAAFRISTALGVPELARGDPIGLLRTDPALLYYITDRLVENGGLPPEDFRADPRIEHPERTDIPAMFTVGEEFLVAWSYLLAGRPMPLHLFALWLMSIVASLTAVGVAGLARELTGSRGMGCFAGVLYVATVASYRTLGYLLLREDLSLPLFALHLYLLARAFRVRTAGAAFAAALPAAAALATWHAMHFVFTVEVACLFAWFLRSGENPLAERASWVFPAVLVAGSFAVPVLWSKFFLLSIPMQMIAALAVMQGLRARGTTPRFGTRVALGLLLLVGFGIACSALERRLDPGAGDYSHVMEMMLAKLRYLGELPEDPGALSYDARLLWQGVFDTGSPRLLLTRLGILAIAVPWAGFSALRAWASGRGDGRGAVLAAFAVASLLLALLVLRLDALAVVPAAALAAVQVHSRFRGRQLAGVAAAMVLVQGAAFVHGFDTTPLRSWYAKTHVGQLAETIRFIRDELPDEGAIASDFVGSSAILAWTSHPVVLQPKYETARSRRRIERFVVSLYHESPREFRRILREELDARYLLIDAAFLWNVRYEAGVRKAAREPPPGSAAHALLIRDERVYRAIPGYRFLHQSGWGRNRYRLYELLEDDS